MLCVLVCLSACLPFSPFSSLSSLTRVPKATIYWAHIGRVIYAASNEQLASLTGPGNKENFTMKWHTRDILLDQQKDVEVIGPVEGMNRVVVEESDGYWKTTRQ